MMLQTRSGCFVKLHLLFAAFLLFFGSGATIHCKAEDAGSHPAYQSYDFGDPDRVVVLGSQPLGVLPAVIPEIMKRDTILQTALRQAQQELRILPFYNGPDINHFMKEGKVDISMAGDFPTLSIASTRDVELVAIVKRDRASVVSYNTYTTLSELEGKRIGFPPGTSSHLGLLVVLQASGLKESDVKMVPMKIDTLTTALVNGTIDAFAGWEPIPAAAIAENRNLKRIAEFLNTDFIYWTSEFAQKQPVVAKHILAAYIRALNWLNANETHLTRGAQWSIAGTEAFLGNNSRLSLVQFKQQIRQNLKLIGSGSIPKSEFADNNFLFRAFSLLKQQGLLAEQSNWERLQRNLRSDLIKEILADQKTYKTHEFNYRLN